MVLPPEQAVGLSVFIIHHSSLSSSTPRSSYVIFYFICFFIDSPLGSLEIEGSIHVFSLRKREGDIKKNE
ncbi:hypothetical protein Hanom_Chr14g01292781 [Helianthus anomalus]